MSNLDNSYKRFQSYQSVGVQNSLKRDFMEQNYKVEKRQDNKELNDKKELKKPQDLSSPDKSFLERSIKLGVNSQGFFRKK